MWLIYSFEGVCNIFGGCWDFCMRDVDIILSRLQFILSGWDFAEVKI